MENVEFLVSPSIAITCGFALPSLARPVPYAILVATWNFKVKYTNPAYRHSGLLQAKVGGLSFWAIEPCSMSEIWILRSEILTTKRTPNLYKLKKGLPYGRGLIILCNKHNILVFPSNGLLKVNFVCEHKATFTKDQKLFKQFILVLHLWSLWSTWYHGIK